LERLNFGLWTSASVRWLPADLWAACGTIPVDRAALRGQPCVLGVDLGESHDHTALVLLFGSEAEGYDAVPFYITCEDGLDDRARRDRASYRDWAREGLLEVVAGETVKFDQLRTVVQALAAEFDVREVALDKWRAKQLMALLSEDGLVVVEVAPTLVNIAPAASALERLLKEGKIRHGGIRFCRGMRPTRWPTPIMSATCGRRRCASGGRIDGIAALVIALARAIVHSETKSVYESRGIIIV
jgi:phage terminase large subunit-like protein